MPVQKVRFGRTARSGLALAAVAMLGATACSRSGVAPETVAARSAPTPSGVTAAGNGGDFGTLKGICGPGTPAGPTSRGLTNSQITIGTMGDPGSVATPGLGEEFFQVAEAFSQWCNAAGGINGRKIKIETYDAKLFNVAPEMLQACKSAFMLVGGGNAADDPGVEPRLKCKLAQMPAYSVSPKATNAGLQVQVTPNPANEYQVGPFNALARLFPQAKEHFGIGGINLASLRPQALRLRDGVEKIGYTVADLQQQPPLVDNWRPYMEEFKQKGVQGFQEISTLDITPLIRAMNDVGWKPQYLFAQAQLYDQRTVAAAKVTQFPTTYVVVNHYPFELAKQNQATTDALRILDSGVKNPRVDDFTAEAFEAWVAWAQAATACGPTLTSDCILQKAGAQTAYTAGGFMPPTNLNPAMRSQPHCYAMMRLTTGGFVYDKNATQPNTDIYNCGADNVVKLTNNYESQ